jgi:hypothetical protein
MLFIFTLRITAGPLAIFEPWMGQKPTPANTARTFLGVSLATHDLPQFGYEDRA